MMRKGWDDALELQNGLKHAVGSDEYAAYLRWFSSGTSKGYNYLDMQEAPRQVDIKASNMEYIAGYIAAHAVSDTYDPMWVNEEVLELVAFAAESFKPEAIIAEDLIVPEAFCVFERALRTVDTQGHDIAYRAVSWGPYEHMTPEPGMPYKRGIAIGLWHHKDDEDDYTRDNAPQFKRRIAGTPLHLMQTIVIPWGDRQAMDMEHSIYELFRQLQVLWRLAKQQVVVGAQWQVSRPTWRSKQNWRQIKTVQVFMLRRSSGGKHVGEEGEEGHYSHRFPVRGHWRNQWYPSEKLHRQIWVDGFIKGPADKPFVAKRRAVEFVR